MDVSILISQELLASIKKNIQKEYFQTHKESIKQAQRKYRAKPKTELQKQSIRDKANKYYQEKIKPVRIPKERPTKYNKNKLKKIDEIVEPLENLNITI